MDYKKKKLSKLVTCIIPTYKKFDFFESAIESVLKQDYPEIELIITDDASDNFNEEYIDSYIRKNKKDNIKNICIIKHKKNIGTVKNLNYAVSQCNGEIIIPLACDDIFRTENIISKIVERFEQSKCQILVCSRLKVSQDLSKKIRQMPHPGYRKFIDKYLDSAENQFVHLAVGEGMEFASGAAMYYKKDFFDKLGGYDERYLLWEDGPFIAKVTREGYAIKTGYDIVSIYYRDGGISSKKQKNNLESRINIDYKNYIINEFLSYPEKFNKEQLKILQYRYDELNNQNKNVLHSFKIKKHFIKIKIIKFLYRYFF